MSRKKIIFFIQKESSHFLKKYRTNIFKIISETLVFTKNRKEIFEIIAN